MTATAQAIDTDVMYRPHVLREYALLADGERGALVGPHGDITWMCAPRWDSEAVFSTLIGVIGMNQRTSIPISLNRGICLEKADIVPSGVYCRRFTS